MILKGDKIMYQKCKNNQIRKKSTKNIKNQKSINKERYLKFQKVPKFQTKYERR